MTWSLVVPTALLFLVFVGGCWLFLVLIGKTWVQGNGEPFVMFAMMFPVYVWIALRVLDYFGRTMRSGGTIPEGVTGFFLFVGLFLPFLALSFDRFGGFND